MNKTINTLFINNGILGVIYGKTIDFFNLLGGNSVLISCLGYNTILNAVVDNLNNMLIIYDTSNNIIFYDLKLSISRVSNNECYPIYRLDTFPIKSIENISNDNKKISDDEDEDKYFTSINDVIEMQIFKNLMFLMKGNKYLIVLDLAFNQKNPELEKVTYYREYLINTNYNKQKLKSFSKILNDIEKRDNYMDNLNEILFKIALINKNDIYILSKTSNFDMSLFRFSKENFSTKNFYLTKDYFESKVNYLDSNQMQEYPLLNIERDDHGSKKMNINNDDMINYNIFNLKTAKIKEDFFYTNRERSLIRMSSLPRKKLNNSIDEFHVEEKYSLKNNLYYRIFYSNINSIFLYSLVILFVIIFCFFLNLYYKKKKEEKERMIKEKMEELQKLNLDKLKGKTNLFENEDNLINKESIEEKNKIDATKEKVKKNIFIESEIKNNILNMNKTQNFSDVDSIEGVNEEENLKIDQIDPKASIRSFINREKNNLGKLKGSKFKEDSY